MLHSSDHLAYTNRLRARHPGEKLIFCAGMLGLALVVPPWPGAIVVLLASLCAALVIARVPWQAYLSLLFTPSLFILASGLTMCISMSWQHGAVSLAWAPDGGHQALLVSLRAFAAVAALVFLICTTPVPDLMLLLRRGGTPPVVIELAILIYRFLSAFSETLHAMYLAQSTRLGYENWRATYRSSAAIAATLLQRVFTRARQMEDGLAARGWEGELRVLSRQTPCSWRICLLVVAGQLCCGGLCYYWSSCLN